MKQATKTCRASLLRLSVRSARTGEALDFVFCAAGITLVTTFVTFGVACDEGGLHLQSRRRQGITDRYRAASASMPTNVT